MSKTIPYTADILAIEFNRSVEKVKIALKVFMDLEMIKISEDNVYKVSNFVKHQNIKVKEGVDKKEGVGNEEISKGNQKESETNSENIIEEGQNCTDDNDSKEKDKKKVSSGEKLETDSNGKIINFENKCNDLISTEANNLLNTDKKKKERKSREKANDVAELFSIDGDEDDDICDWGDEEIIPGDVIDEFSF